MSFTETGGFGLFYYPPTFAPLLLPFGAAVGAAATWVWIGLSLVAFVVGVAILPVSRSVRWWILLLAGLSFPFVYAVKLGQVGPILFLLFADRLALARRPGRGLGVSAALGAAIKLQPGLVLVWALLTRRLRAVVVGRRRARRAGRRRRPCSRARAHGPTSSMLLRTVSDPIATERNLTPGRGRVPARGARQRSPRWSSSLSTVGVVVASSRRSAGRPTRRRISSPSIASQLVSPILWDHYAMLLLLPVAYLRPPGAGGRSRSRS